MRRRAVVYMLLKIQASYSNPKGYLELLVYT